MGRSRADDVQEVFLERSIVMVRMTLGFTLMCLGVMGGDSEKLWLPLMLIAIGAVLMLWHNEE